uniref:Uncharacterized protein n=1 Tax=Lactuca sativa TaxID=4236 RepID=A0A9R1W880_LACSA|nr:hypothetical protein LSAT_V11C300109090 [Lactuca sativa]
MARCRGVVPNMNGRPWAKSKIGYKDKIANLKQGKCMWVVLVPRLKEIDALKLITNYKYLTTNIVKQIVSNPTILFRALQESYLEI